MTNRTSTCPSTINPSSMQSFTPPYSPAPDDHPKKEQRFVRFLLSPPPDDTMETRTREQRIVSTTAQKAEEDKFGKASGWGREELRLLGVDFHMKRRVDLSRILGVKESEWSAELRERVAEGSRQLAAVDMKELNDGKIKLNTVRRKLAPDFLYTFESLLAVMAIQETKLRAKQAKQATQMPVDSTSRKRPVNSPTPPTFPPPKKPKTDDPSSPPSPDPKTPDQPTHPANPNLTGGSVESKDEENTKMLLKFFVNDVLSVLEAEFCEPTWQRSGHFVEICRTERDQMSFKLGTETINPINDGGLGIRYNLGDGYIDWQPGGIRPVLSLEAKRRKSKRRDDIELVYQYAGQVLAEMLGQTCHKEFYENNQMRYQEAFVIHGSHSSITIYYAKFPNTYLRTISKHGTKYLSHSSERVLLRRTKKFHMRSSEERVELFQILAKLLWYLISGKSHVGYLCNYDNNPLHNLGRVVYDSITVEIPVESAGEEGSGSSGFSEASDAEEDILEEDSDIEMQDEITVL